MHKTPSISVIITTYNYGSYVTKALESILNQSILIDEILLINDGSTDNTEELIKPFLKNPRVIYIPQPNLGQTKAKNIGIKKATGDLIAFLDADDWWEKTKLEEQLPLFENPKTGVVYCRQTFVDQFNQPFKKQPDRLEPYRGRVVAPLLLDNFIPFSSAVVKRECFDKFGLFDESLPMSIDWDLWLRFSMSYEFDFMDENLLCYRQNHAFQMSKNTQLRKECCDIIFKRFIEKNKDNLSSEDVQRAKIYTYNTRAYSSRWTNPAQSLNYYVQSLKEKPFQVTAVKGLLMTLVPAVKRGMK